MWRSRFIVSLVVVVAAAHLQAAELRITCEPGNRVLIDGEPAGDCTPADDGLVVEGLDAGRYVVRLEGTGTEATEVAVDVGESSQQIAFAGGGSAGNDGAGSGAIEIVTDVPRCWVEVRGRRVEKREELLTVLGVPVGRQTVWLQELGTLLEARVEVVPGAPVRLAASFAERTTEVRAPEPEVASRGGDSSGDGGDAEECYHYWIEVLQTSSVEKVGRVSDILDEAGYPVYRQDAVTVHTGEMPLYKLRIGPFANRLSAERALFKIGSRDLPGGRVLREPCR